MTLPRDGRPSGADPVGLASILALISAIATLAYPPFSGLTLALVALAAGACLVDLRRRHPERLRVAPRTAGAFAVLGGAVVLFALGPSELSAFGPFGLAGGALLLWWSQRSDPGPGREALP